MKVIFPKEGRPARQRSQASSRSSEKEASSWSQEAGSEDKPIPGHPREEMWAGAKGQEAELGHCMRSLIAS